MHDDENGNDDKSLEVMSETDLMDELMALIS
jgi:hypothetical protein